ncbi:hypothetical protein A8F94_00930 [Bacillus sp. FJAT-27225]|uniref:hypothetical protein n=1 Tax=Bacillus sp. FJAT-27225 TaxID=1743144 RepID=UPI00080C2502|nr:hypothetical protein [Bacillus sp. FJAT-27225]OCA90484.1 hypothetical protein A8F94_00930 [Bacillus sp. FJAT-27225]
MEYQKHLLSGEEVLEFEFDKRQGIFISNRRVFKIEVVPHRRDNIASIPLNKIQKVSLLSNGTELHINTAAGNLQYMFNTKQYKGEQIIRQLLELICK